jgi:threonine dehydratase
VKVIGTEPETAAPYASSLANGGPQRFPNWQASFVDGAGGKSVTERMWQRMQAVVDGTVTVTLDEVRDAMRSIAEKSRAIAEGAGALSLAAALTGQAGDGPIVCVVSGGNIDLAKFAELVTSP